MSDLELSDDNKWIWDEVYRLPFDEQVIIMAKLGEHLAFYAGDWSVIDHFKTYEK